MKSHASMNRIYRLVWNAALNLWVAVAENARGKSKGGSIRSSVDGSSVHQGDGGHGGDGGSSGFTLNTACRAALALMVSTALFSTQTHAADAANAAVVAGAGTVATAGNVTTVSQATQKLAIDWTSLSTRANEGLVFNQPNASAIALNRIIGSSPSEMLGSLTANGQVFILNPNGVLFGAGSQVNVGGLVASTLSMSNADFMAGNHVFSNNGSSGSVVNQGTLNAAPGGYLALLAPEVRNEGIMTASLGTALLAAGNKVTLNLDNGNLLGYSIDQGAINALAENKQLIQAGGGQVLLGAKALDSLTTATVNNTGVIEAKTIQNKAGRIMLMGDMETGTVNVGGTLDASAANGGDGGFIETSAAHVKVASGTRITTQAPQGKTGKWLIDPQDYTIAASGGDITGADLSAQLATTDVEIQSVNGGQSGSGDIHVNDAVSWSANQLTLTAERDINVNTVMSATGSASLALNTGATGNLNMKMKADGNGFDGRVDLDTSGTLHINGEQYTIIRSLGANANSMTGTDLQGMRANPNGRYVLGTDIDASASANGDMYAASDWSDNYLPDVGYTGRIGMRPLSSDTNPFSGKFDGLGHRISNALMGMDVLRPADGSNPYPVLDSTRPLGLFGAIAPSGKISNLGLNGLRNDAVVFGYESWDMPPGAPGVNVVYGWYGAIGSLAGTNAGSVRNVLVNPYAIGIVDAAWVVGGVVGDNTGTMQNVRAAPHAMGGGVLPFGSPKYVGGIAGINRGLIEDASSEVRVGGLIVGGIAGFNDGMGVVRDSSASGSVEGIQVAGGAVGSNAGLVDRVQSSATVSQAGIVGGLVGANTSTTTSTIQDSSASGYVEGGGIGAFSFPRFDPTLGTWDATYVPVGDAGGLVGRITGGSIIRSHASGAVHLIDHPGRLGSMFFSVGGLVGTAEPGVGPVTISDSWASGNVSLADGVPSNTGGFAGRLEAILIERAYATGNVDVGRAVTDYITTGGFVGDAFHVTIRQSYATGNVQGVTGNLAGFAGHFFGSATSLVEDCYATGNVTVTESGRAGGFVIQTAVKVTNSYATGTVVAPNAWAFGETTHPGNANLFYNSTANPNLQLSANQTGKTEAELKQASTYTGFGNVSATGGSGSVWRIYEGQTTPLLTAFLKPLTVTADDVNKVYDGTSVGLANVGYSDSAAASSGQVLGLANPYGNVTKNNVGSYGAGLYSTQQGYDITMVGGNLTVTPATLTVSGVTADNKVYDGSMAATLQAGGAAVSGVVAGDMVNFDANGLAGVFSDKNAGTGKTVTLAGGGISGADAGNYTLGSSTPLMANIDKRALTVSATGVDKVYDRSTGATVTLGDDRVASDVLTLGYGAAQFADWNAGTNKAVSVGGIAVSGADAGNYTFNTSAATTATITPASLTLTTSNVTKTYDGGLSASGTAVVTAGTIFAGDSASGGAFAFTDKNFGVGNKTVTTSGVTVGDGVNNANYNVTYADNTTSTINKANLTVTATGVTKTYDGTTSATGTGSVGTLAGAGAGESVNTAATQVFTDKNFGIGNRTVQASGLTIKDSGNADVTGNYNISYVDNTTSTINKANLTVTATGVTKTYDGTTSATGTGSVGTLAGAGAGEVIDAAGSQAFLDKNFGIGNRSVRASGVSIKDSGNTDVTGNYNIAYVDNTTSTINKADLSLSTADVTKTYDGGFFAAGTVIVTAGTVFAGDAASGGAFTFIDKNVGTGNKTVLTSGVTVGDGVNNGNYNVSYVANTTSTINQANLVLTANNVTKTYDGTVAASGTAAVSAGTLFGGDSLTGGSFAFTDKNAGTGNKTVTASGVTVGDGVNNGNYNVSYVDNTTSTINKADLTVTANAVTRTYDGTLNASGTGSVGALAGAGAGESVNTAATQAFTDKNFGIGNKTVRASGLTIKDSGNADVTGNYNISYVDNTVSTINKANLTLSTSDVTKTYDGTTGAAGTVLVTAGTVFAGDSTTGGSFAFTDKNAGAGNKTVTTAGVTVGDGVNSGNYNVSYVDNTTSTINQASLTVSTGNVTKTYDGNTSAAGTATVTGGTLFGGDSLTGGSFAFTDRNAGNGNKTVQASGVTVGDGVNNGNYAVTYADNTTSTINPFAVSVSGTRTYDGTADVAAGVLTIGPLVGSETLGLSGLATMADKNVGTNKALTVAGLSLVDGTGSAGNYTFTGGTQQASITQASLTVGSANVTKTYDSTTTAAGTATVTGGTLFAGDSLTGGSFAFTDKNAGTGNKTVTTSGVTVGDGVNNGNYAVTYTSNTTSTINKADLTVTASGVDKVYDGSTAALVGYGDNRLGSDVLSITGTASFADKNAGTGKSVGVNSIALGGTDAGNYNLLNTTANTTASITPKALTVTANGDTRLYDGAAYSGGNGVSYNGFVAGDSVADITGTLAYGGSSQGATAAGSYFITPGGLGSLSGNYALGYVSGLLDITAGNAESAALGGNSLVPGYRSLLTLVASPQLPNVSGDDGKGNGGGDAAAAALNAAAAEAASQGGGE